jgi:hypothetical protein
MQQAEAADAEDSSDGEGNQPSSQVLRHLDGSNETPQQPPQSSIVEDLGDPSDDESVSQQPPMGSIVEDLGDPSDSEMEL